MVDLPDALKKRILDYVEAEGGRAYAPIPHESLAQVPFSQGPERFEMIRPHLPTGGGTALDIGTHWGYLAHRLEDEGFEVTAVERSPRIIDILVGLRDAAHKRFKVFHGSVFDLPESHFSVVIAFNIFHHFLKTRELYEGMLEFLERLECNFMFFQSHEANEQQMLAAYKNFDQLEFAKFIAERCKLSRVEVLGKYKRRTIFKLSK